MYLVPFLRYSEIVVENRVFTPLHFLRPFQGSSLDYCHTVWCGKTRMVSLPDGEKSLRIRLAVSTEYRRVTDRQTNRRIDRHLATA